MSNVQRFADSTWNVAIYVNVRARLGALSNGESFPKPPEYVPDDVWDRVERAAEEKFKQLRVEKSGGWLRVADVWQKLDAEIELAQALFRDAKASGEPWVETFVAAVKELVGDETKPPAVAHLSVLHAMQIEPRVTNLEL